MERSLINEGKFEILRGQYPPDIISNKVLNVLFHADPSPGHKYFDWMVKQNIKTTSTPYDVNNQIISLVKDFYHLNDDIQIKDINFYNDLHRLHDTVNSVKDRFNKYRRKEFEKGSGFQIHEDIVFRVVRVSRPSAVCVYGYDAQWCRSSIKENTLYDYFENYIVYIVLNKKTQDRQLRKIAVLIDKDFKGSKQEADLDDYLVIDGENEEHEGSITELTNEYVSDVIFNDFHILSATEKKVDFKIPKEVKTFKDKVTEKNSTPEKVIKEWSKDKGLKRKHIDLLTETYYKYVSPLMEGYKSPELKVDDRVRLIHMGKESHTTLKIGDKGTVTSVEPTPWGVQYGMRWDNGSTLSLIPKVDVYEILDSNEV